MLTAKDSKTSKTFNNDMEVHSKSNTLTDDKEPVSKISSNECNGKYKPKAVKHKANDSSNEDQDERVTPAKKRKKHSSDDDDDTADEPMPKLKKCQNQPINGVPTTGVLKASFLLDIGSWLLLLV
nr:unnamed protein product [Timema bartmani]